MSWVVVRRRREPNSPLYLRWHPGIALAELRQDARRRWGCQEVPRLGTSWQAGHRRSARGYDWPWSPLNPHTALPLTVCRLCHLSLVGTVSINVSIMAAGSSGSHIIISSTDIHQRPQRLGNVLCWNASPPPGNHVNPEGPRVRLLISKLAVAVVGCQQVC